MEHAFFGWEFVNSVSSPTSDTLQVILYVPSSNIAMMHTLPFHFIPSIIRTIQCSVPVEYVIKNGEGKYITFEAATAPFDLIHWTLAHLTAAAEILCSDSFHRQECTVALLANIDHFPDRSISLLHFSNYLYQPKVSESLKKLILSLDLIGSLEKAGISVIQPLDQNSSSLLPSHEYAPPLAPSAQCWFSSLPHHKWDTGIRNLVLIVFSTSGRDSSDIARLTSSCVNRCFRSLLEKCPDFFPDLQATPIVPITFTPNAASQGHTGSKKSSLPPSKPSSVAHIKKSSPLASASKSKRKSTSSSVPSQRGKASSSNPFSSQITSTKPQSTPGPLSSTIEPSSTAALSISASTMEAPKNTRQAKRKRAAAPRDEDSIIKEKELYMNSIVDSISSIVQESSNLDFVTEAFAKLGLSTSTSLSAGDESASIRIAQFRQILERNLRSAVQLSEQHKRSAANASGLSERELDLRDLAEEEELEWIENLSAEEIEELWTPIPAMPSDSNWDEVLWAPCTIEDLNEDTFDVIVM